MWGKIVIPMYRLRLHGLYGHARKISQNDAVNVYLPLSVFISNTFSMLYQFLFRCGTLNTIIPLGIDILRNATQRKYLKWKHARNISQNDAVNVYLPLSVFISNTFSMLYQFLLRCVAQITNIISCCVALRKLPLAECNQRRKFRQWHFHSMGTQRPVRSNKYFWICNTMWYMATDKIKDILIYLNRKECIFTCKNGDTDVKRK